MKMKKAFAFVGLLCALLVGALVHQSDVSAASLTSRVLVDVGGSLTGTAGLVTPTATIATRKEISFASGVAANQADSIYHQTASIASGGTLSLDVKGSLTDVFGTAFTPAKLKAVYIHSCGAAGTTTTCPGVTTANTTNLTLFGDTNAVPILNTAATTSTLQPGGIFLVVQPPLAGIAVTAGTGDIIKIVNAAGATAYVDIVLIGTSS